jgi:hypothetical protein
VCSGFGAVGFCAAGIALAGAVGGGAVLLLLVNRVVFVLCRQRRCECVYHSSAYSWLLVRADLQHCMITQQQPVCLVGACNHCVAGLRVQLGSIYNHYWRSIRKADRLLGRVA